MYKRKNNYTSTPLKTRATRFKINWGTRWMDERGQKSGEKATKNKKRKWK